MIASPSLRSIEQRFSNTARPPIWSDGQIFDPGSLAESDGDNVEIDGRKSNDRAIVLGNQDGRPLLRDDWL